MTEQKRRRQRGRAMFANLHRLTLKKREAFLAHLETHGLVNKACEAIGFARQSLYALRARDGQFKERWDDAIRDFIEMLEAEADRRAVEGVDHPITYKGKITGTYKEYSDSLLMFRLKKLDPSYRDRQDMNVNLGSKRAEDFYREIQEKMGDGKN